MKKFHYDKLDISMIFDYPIKNPT